MDLKKNSEAYRIYHAEATVLQLKIRDSDGNRVGTLTIEPGAHARAVTWLSKYKQKKASTKKKTLLNLIEWLES